MAQPHPKLTAAEYLAFERQAENKSEFLNGEMFAMSGASFKHNLIVSNLLRELGNALRARACDVLPPDMRVHFPATGLYNPDVTVVCGNAEFVDDEFDTLTNPTVLVEVLSPPTADYDRGHEVWQLPKHSLAARGFAGGPRRHPRRSLSKARG